LQPLYLGREPKARVATLPELVVTSVAIDHKMVVLHFQVGKNFIEDVLLDGGFGVNIIMEK
jgi:hypothetical protein